jgi:PAS domain S-box-containing protein
MGKTLRVLLVEDSLSDSLALLRELEESGYDLVHERVDTPEAMSSAIDSGTWDVVIADYAVPEFGALEAFELIKNKGLKLPFIIVAEPISEDIAVSAVQAGVEDIIMKGNLARLVPTVERVLGDKGDRREQKAPDKVLEETMDHLAKMIESSADAIFSTNRTGELVLFNKGAELMLGYQRGEVVSQPASLLFGSEEGVEELKSQLRESMGVVSALETALRAKDGRSVPVSVSASTLYSEDGKEAGFVGFCKDVGETKSTEETMERFARQNAAVAQFVSLAHKEVESQNLMDAAVLLIAEALCVEFCEVLKLEDSGESLLLVSGVGWPDELIGSAKVGVGPDSLAGYAFGEGRPVVVMDLKAEKRFKGSTLLNEHGAVSVLKVPMASGDFTFGVMGAHSTKKRDFSDDEVHFLEAVAGLLVASVLRKRARKELDRADEELSRRVKKVERAQEQLIIAEKSAAMERITTGVSQDVLNPLNVISLRLQMINEDPAMPPDMTRHLKALEEQASKITKKFRDLLHYARQRPPERLEVNLNDVVTRALERLEQDLDRDKITLELRLTESLPPVLADEEQLQQVILSLLDNAREAMPEGGKLVLATVALQKNGQNYVEFKIEDMGSGITPEDMGKLFDPFFTTKPEGEGSGLGLCVCQSIVEAHGGTIKAESEEGAGATFSFELPVEQGKERVDKKSES